MTDSFSPLAGAAIVFDLDGTLVDTAPDLVGALDSLLAERGMPPAPPAEARLMIGRGARALLERGFAAAGSAIAPQEMGPIFERFIEIYRGRIAAISRPYPGVAAALDDLAAAGARLAVCTNKRTDLSRTLLAALGLAGRFAAVVGPDAAGAAKPDPRHLLAAIEAAGGVAARALMLGDSRTDLDAARAAAVPVALVSFGYSDVPVQDLAPDALLHRFADLPDLARGLLGRPAAAISPSLPRPADA
ncbi:MAG TPA: HAD-IA family hydrolase [Caulobacteraceae bacterium]|nr:HAD-IA family hydrolase [Caulobacteraceae bacterium]